MRTVRTTKKWGAGDAVQGALPPNRRVSGLNFRHAARPGEDSTEFDWSVSRDHFVFDSGCEAANMAARRSCPRPAPTSSSSGEATWRPPRISGSDRDGSRLASPASRPYVPPASSNRNGTMRTEIQSTVDQIKQAMSLLRRHL